MCSYLINFKYSHFFRQNLTSFLQLHHSYMPQNKEFCDDYLVIISIFRFFQAGKKKLKWALFEIILVEHTPSKRKKNTTFVVSQSHSTHIASFILKQYVVLSYIPTFTACLSFLKFTFTFNPWPHLVYLAQKSRYVAYQSFSVDISDPSLGFKKILLLRLPEFNLTIFLESFTLPSGHTPSF